MVSVLLKARNSVEVRALTWVVVKLLRLVVVKAPTLDDDKDAT